MKIKILEEAERDLINGFRFYEAQNFGLGQYFLDSLFSDIDSLQLFADIHQWYFGYQRLLSRGFHLPYIIRLTMTSLESAQCWIAVRTLRRSKIG
jgi:hypothetical protein